MDSWSRRTAPMGRAAVAIAPQAGLFAVVTAVAVHSMTLDLRTSAIAGAAAAMVTLAVTAGRAWSQSGTPATPPRAAGWPSKVLAITCSLLGVVLLVGSADRTLSRSDAIFGLSLGTALLVTAVLAWTGRPKAWLRSAKAVLGASPRLRTAFYIALVGGSMLLAIGLSGFISVAGLRAHGVTTTAEVTHVTHLKSVATYFLRYRLTSGRVVTCSTEDVLTDPAPGDTIDVLYDSTDPAVNCQSADYGTGYADSVVFTAIGTVALLVALGLLVGARIRFTRAEASD